MGCGVSGNEKTNKTFEVPEHLLATQMAMNGMKTSETIYQAFKRLDQQICKVEGMCPGPRLTTTEAWIEFLESDQSRRTSSSPKDSENRDQNVTLDFRENGDQMAFEKLNLEKVGQLAIQCDVAFNVEKASKNEEFLASVSKSHMSSMELHLLNDIIDHGKRRAKALSDSYNSLRLLYAEQDGLLGTVSSGSYTSKLEQRLDDQLEQCRQIRDKMGAVAEQWHTSANLLKTSTKSAMLAVECWNIVELSQNAKDRITQALDCRQFIVQSIVALEYSQKALPQVDFHHITPRQISAVKHANLYLLTDLANPSRYTHTKRVLHSFQISLNLAVTWLFETYNKSLRKDLNHSEENVITLAKELRHQRLEYIAQTIGTNLYVPAVGIQ